MNSIKKTCLLLLFVLTLAACNPKQFYFTTSVTRTPTQPPLPTHTSRPKPSPVLPTKVPAGLPKSSHYLAFPVMCTRSSRTVAHTPGDRYQLQAGMPRDTINYTHPELGCKYMAVAGQVFLPDNRVVAGLIVEVSGTLDGLEFKRLGITGNSPAVGPGGFEVRLADYPIYSEASVSVRLFDVSGKQVADPVLINTYTDCNRQLIIVNYIKIP